MYGEPAAQVAELVEADGMVESTVAFRGEERVLVQPGAHGEKLRLGDHRIAIAVTEERGNVKWRDTVVGGRCAADEPRRKESGQ